MDDNLPGAGSSGFEARGGQNRRTAFSRDGRGRGRGQGNWRSGQQDNWRGRNYQRRPYSISIIDDQRPRRDYRSADRHGHGSRSVLLNQGPRPSRTMGFRFVQKLLENDDIQQVILELSNDRNGFEKLLESTEISNDVIVLLAKLLRNICGASFHASKITLLNSAIRSRFMEKLTAFVADIIHQDEQDRKLNQQFWHDPDEFWQCVIKLSKTVQELIPTKCEPIKKLLRNMSVFIPMIEEKNLIHVSDTIKSQTNSLLDVVDRSLKNLEVKKQCVQQNIPADDDVEPPNDFREIEIIPSAEEIASGKSPFLRENIIDRPFKNVEQYLDIQFRLLREDFVAPLRRGIRTFLKNQGKPKIEWEKLDDIKIHTPIRFLCVETLNEYNCYKIRFDFCNKKKEFKYEDSKRFMFGSLVCFTRDNFRSLLFGKIVQRDEKLLQQGILIVGFQNKVKVSFEHDYLMVESSVYFEPYYHVLAVLKGMHPDTFPMERYLIRVETDSRHPQYLLRTEGITYKVEGVRVSPLEMPSRTFYNFNDSQLAAFKAALSDEFSIIQGPPGTGKTYLGLKITHVLLENYFVWHKKTPILVICYTNHALDQFLEGILPVTKKLLRIGGQSKNEKLKEFNLTVQRRNVHDAPAVHGKRSEVQEYMEELKTISDTLNHIEANESVISFDCFKKIIKNYEQTWFAGAKDDDIRKWLLEGKSSNQQAFAGRNDPRGLSERHPFILTPIMAKENGNINISSRSRLMVQRCLKPTDLLIEIEHFRGDDFSFFCDDVVMRLPSPLFNIERNISNMGTVTIKFDFNFDDEMSEDSDPFATDGSDNEYIPSTPYQSFSSDESDYPSRKIDGKNYQTDSSKSSNKTSPVINIISQIIIPAEQDLQYSDNDSADSGFNTECEVSPFEYHNSFRDGCSLDDDTIRRVSIFFQNIVETKREKSVKKKETLYDSPWLMRNKYKKTLCKFCDQEVISRHFSRHLERKHKEEREVIELVATKPNSKEKKQLLSLIRNQGSLDDGLRGKVRPKKCKIGEEVNERDFALCKYCKGFYKRLYLSRHLKKCFAKPSDIKDVARPLTESYIYTACQKKHGEILNKLQVKTEVFERMQPDEITRMATSDILIIYYAEDLLKKTKMKRRFSYISNKIRECAKFLIEMKKTEPYADFISILRPENFDNTIEAVKTLSRYDISKRNFGAASLALHFRTTLINLCDLAAKLILRRKIPYLYPNIDKRLTELERFKNLVDTQWATEIGSLALKDLNEKSAMKPKLLPITEDIIKLARLVEEKADDAYKILINRKDVEAYRVLVETVLVATILHNRKRVGDVQYLEWHSFKEQFEAENTILQTEMASSLSENERILTQSYKRVVSIGKGSRPVTILIPKKMFKYFTLLCLLRNEPWFPIGNTYLFTYPNSKFWIDGCSVIRKYARLCKAKYPQLLTSCKLRKHIATVTQLLNLQSNEIDQLAKFMGHTTRTHENFYKLPQDVYQIAKVSKILQIMEKGNAAEFKNKTLEEIDVDMNEIGSVLQGDDDFGLAGDTLGEKCSPIDNEKDQHLFISTLGEENDNLITISGKEISQNEELEGLLCQEQRAENVAQASDHANRSTGNEQSKKGSRKRWSAVQKKLMKKCFSSQLKSKKTLRKEECKAFIDAYKSIFDGVSWVRVKTFIYNESRLSSLD